MLFGLIYQKNGHLQMLLKFGNLFHHVFFLQSAIWKKFTWCNVIQPDNFPDGKSLS